MHTHTRMRGVMIAGVALALPVAAAGCGDDDDGTKKVGVKLGEYSVTPSTANAKPGEVKFETENVGGTTHEFVVVRAGSASSLPTSPDGAVDEEQVEEADAIGEIEDIEPKAKESVTFDLEAGEYVLFCNVVDDTEDPAISHFAEGMSAEFTVSD